jgi:uncharacterized protein
MLNNQFIRRFITGLATILLIGGLMILPGRVQPQASAQQPVDQQPMVRSVTVNGSGSAIVQPDMANVTVGVQTQAQTASQALNQNNQQMQSVMQALQAGGIASTDIQTFTIQLYPRYDNQFPRPPDSPTTDQDDQNAVTGYTAINTVQITVRNLENLGVVLDQIVEAGGNRIEHIRFDVANQAQALEQARIAAFENATQKAEQLAGLADAELGQVLTINESSFFPMAFREAAADMAQAGSAVPISPGTQTINIDVVVTWELQ